MADTTELSTFTDIGAWNICFCPSGSKQSWYRIALNTEVGDPPAVDYVVTCYQEANFLTRWNNRKVSITFEK